MKENMDVMLKPVDANGNFGYEQKSKNIQEMASKQFGEFSPILNEKTNILNARTTTCTAAREIHDNGTQFCPDCVDFVCEMCENKHSSHKVLKLRDAGKLYRDRMRVEVLKVRNLIQYSTIVQKDMRSYLEKLTNSLAEITEQILKRAQNLPEGIELVAQAMINDIQTEHEIESNRLQDKMKDFDKFVTSLSVIAVRCEDIINLSDDKHILKKGEKFLSTMSNLESELPVGLTERCIYILSPVPSAKPGESLRPEESLGEFSKASVPWRIEVQRIGSYRPEAVASSRFVTTMCPAVNENGVWVVWHWGPLVHLVDKDGNVKKTINAGCKVDDICTDSSGHLVISCHEAKCIKVLNDNYEVANTIETEKVPRGIHSKSEDELVVCCVQNLHHRNGDRSSVFNVNSSESEVEELTKTDCLIQPWRVAVNVNGDICVSDRNKGSVVIFDSQGNVKAEYSGPDLPTRHAFAPHGICCDKYGQIFVVDYTNHTVHVLDPLGRFRGFLIMDTELEKKAIFMGTSSPFSITVDNAGDLWVGNKFGFLTVLRYQI